MMAVIAVIMLLLLILLAIGGRIGQGTFVFRVLLALDIFGCMLIFGTADLTISSRCGMYLRQPAGPWLWRALGRLLNRCSKNHCEGAIAFDRKRAMEAYGFLTLPQMPAQPPPIPQAKGPKPV